jgi:hypothetical protein
MAHLPHLIVAVLITWLIVNALVAVLLTPWTDSISPVIEDGLQRTDIGGRHK